MEPRLAETVGDLHYVENQVVSLLSFLPYSAPIKKVLQESGPTV